MALGKIYENTNTLVTISRPIMKRLAEDAGESVALFQLDGDTSFCLSREYGSSSLVFTIQEGDNMELHASAAGRVLLTYGSAELRKKILTQTKFEKFTSETITDPKKIQKELDLIRKRGYAVNRGERELEVAAIAAPIFNHDNKVESALAIVGPVQRFPNDRESSIAESLLQATRRISELLGAPPAR
jgi:DNA-binding IclR family transcriptional regulator